MSAAPAGRGLRSGTSTVGAGLLLFGATSYAFLALAARSCGPSRFATLSLLWITTTTLGAGLFLPLEQELARFIGDRRGRGAPAGAGLISAGVGSALVLAVLALVTAVWIGPLTTLFNGDRATVLAVLANLAGQALAYLSRGVAAGTQRYPIYGGQLAAEGLLRVLAAAALSAAGVHTAAPFGFALAASTVLSVVVAGPATRALLHGRGAPASRAEVSRNLAWLMLAALASQALANSTPVLVRLLGPARDIATAQFFATLLVARLPLFLFAAVQAVFLPGLSRALGAGDVPAFRATLRRVATLVTAIGAASIVGAALVGTPIVGLVFGPAYRLGRGDLVLLAAGTAVYLCAGVQAQAALALSRHRGVATGWLLGLLLGLVIALLPGPLLLRVEMSFLTGSAGAAVVLMLTVRRAAGQLGSRPDTTNSLYGNTLPTARGNGKE